MTIGSFDSPYLMQTDALAARLDDPGLRVFDCTQRLVPDPVRHVRAENCRAEFEQAHVPGAGYLDIGADLSDAESRWRYMRPESEDLAARFAERGIGDDSRVVLYDTSSMMWATRVWLMLRSIGFDNVAVLDGGFRKWRAEARDTSDGPGDYPPSPSLAVRPAKEAFVGKDAVRVAMAAPDSALVHSLTPEQFVGEGIHYGRPGRIPGSLNVAARDLTDADTGALKAPAEVRAMFADAGVALDRPILCYCGGGIAATLDAFALTLLGAENVTVYDASLQEWATDDSLPMVTD